MARDYYEALGLSRDATPDQIQQAFRSLARKYHPDVNKDPGAAIFNIAHYGAVADLFDVADELTTQLSD